MEFVRALSILVSVLLFCGFAAARTPQKRWSVEEDRCRTEDGNSGICVSITDCKILYNFIQENVITDEIKQIIVKYKCGQSNSQWVCCPSKLPPELEKHKTLDFTKHANYKLLPSNCGQTGSDNKITNGNETNLFEYPFAVVLKYDKPVNPWGCGASLISARYVLTAAHCIKSKHPLTTIRLGEHDLRTDPDCDATYGEELCADKVQDFAFKKEDAIVHPGYSETTYQNDIALIRLPTPAKLDYNGALPICIPTTEDELTRVFKNFTVIGWGATETGFVSPILLKVFVPRIETAECAPNYAPKTILTDNQLCAGGKKEQDSCTGDSGGPLTVTYIGTHNTRMIQYGIVSLGPRICGKEGFPAVYTRVDKYVGWILDNMKP